MSNDLNARRDAAWKAMREGDTIVVLVTLFQIAETVREVRPDAPSVRFEWSDQGDWLTPRDLDSDTDLDDDTLDNLYELAAYLEGNNQSLWSPYLFEPADKHGRGFLTFDLTRCALAVDVLDGKATLPTETPEA